MLKFDLIQSDTASADGSDPGTHARCRLCSLIPARPNLIGLSSGLGPCGPSPLAAGRASGCGLLATDIDAILNELASLVLPVLIQGAPSHEQLRPTPARIAKACR